MITILPGTIIPWLLGGLVLLVLLTSSIMVKSWHEAKRSPYFFLRVQAAKRMQTYLVATIGLIMLALATTAYAWKAPEDVTPRIAPLSHAKPEPASVPLSDADITSLEAAASPTTVEISLGPVSERRIGSIPGLDDPLLQPRVLPAEYDQFEPKAELVDSTDIGDISFSLDITDNYQAIDAGSRFGEGYFTLYATFAYEDMADGMVWSWVWRRNGQVVEGGNQVWNYGQDGPGYIYLRPEEGFQLGDYDLEVWVNGEMLAQEDFLITDAIAASN